jgi:hypothetical protein
LSHGFTVLMLVELVRAGLETATAERVVVGGKTVEIVGVRITAAGRASISAVNAMWIEFKAELLTEKKLQQWFEFFRRKAKAPGKPLFTGRPLPPTSRRFPRYYDIICRLACGPLSVTLEQTMLSGTLSHPNVAHTLSYRLMAHASRVLAAISCVAAFTASACAAEPTQITILATNDIHGGIEPNRLKDGAVEGGLAPSRAPFKPSKRA